MGKVAPMTEKLRAAHRLQMLIDMRRDGATPKANVPNPCAANTARMPNISVTTGPPALGKPRLPYIYIRYIFLPDGVQMRLVLDCYFIAPFQVHAVKLVKIEQ